MRTSASSRIAPHAESFGRGGGRHQRGASPPRTALHAFDTVKGSDYLGDQDAIEILASEAPGDIYQLEHWGCVFSRNDEGTLAQRPFGAAGSPRTVYSADITGHVLIHVLYDSGMKRQEQGPLEVYEEYFAWRLVIEDGAASASSAGISSAAA